MPTTKDDLQYLTLLGSNDTPTGKIECFPNHAGNRMKITLLCTEFTSRCPLTNQPDFAEIEIEYEPDQWIAETKSVKLLLEEYREVGIFYEHLAVELGERFVQFVKPFSLTVNAKFNVRGGISVTATYHHNRDQA